MSKKCRVCDNTKELEECKYTVYDGVVYGVPVTNPPT